MKTHHLLTGLLLGALLLTGCVSQARVGPLQTESKSVELGNGEPISVEINLGAGDLEVTGGAEKLLEGDFTYNVDRLKPEVTYQNGVLSVRHPDNEGLPVLRGITGFRNEWNLRLNNEVPMDMTVNMGAGNCDLQLADLALTGLDVTLGAGTSTLDLRGGWTRDLDVALDSGAAQITVRLPRDIGVRVEVNAGPTAIDTQGLTKDGNVYTNAAYGTSPVTLDMNIQSGVGAIKLEVEE